MKPKQAIVIVGSMIILMMLASMLLPTNIAITRGIDIPAPPATVADYISDFSKWDLWYPPLNEGKARAELIREDKMKITGKDGKTLLLTREIAGEGRVVIGIESSGSDVTYDFILFPDDGNTRLVLNTLTELGKWPWQRAKGLFLEKVTGPQLEAMLQDLRAVGN